MKHTLNSGAISYFQLVIQKSLTGLMTAVLLIAFHFEHLQTTASGYFYLNRNLTARCKMMAKGFFLTNLYDFLLSTLVYFETYRTLKSLHSRKHCNKPYFISLAFVLSIAVVSIQITGMGDEPNTLCMVKLNSLEKSLVLIVQGLLCFAMTALNVAILTRMRRTRKASGRKKTSNDKRIIARFSTYNLIVTLTFALDIIHHAIAINHNVVRLAINIFQVMVTPVAFPVIFVLSTRQFKEKVKKIC